MSLPIVFVHLGGAAHLKYAIAQAKVSNPKSDVVLIGDHHQRYLKFVYHANFEAYAAEALEFKQAYQDKHLSPNGFEYELICFQRWFALRQFMRDNQLERCLYLDSDVMLYGALAQEQLKFEAYEATISRGACAHNSFWSLQGLDRFCQFLMSFYTDPERFEVLKSIRAKMIAANSIAGISDMTLLSLFYKENTALIGETSEIINGSVYDQNINQSDGFKMQNGMKQIQFVNRQPFGESTKTGELVRFNTLHFQGPAKQLMKTYFSGNLMGLRSQVFYGKVMTRIQAR